MKSKSLHLRHFNFLCQLSLVWVCINFIAGFTLDVTKALEAVDRISESIDGAISTIKKNVQQRYIRVSSR